ncbi:MAG: hypothetical protein VB858_07015 [Planctomycetaceae bacterium]
MLPRLIVIVYAGSGTPSRQEVGSDERFSITQTILNRSAMVDNRDWSIVVIEFCIRGDS